MREGDELKLMNSKEVAARLGVSVRRVRQFAKSGQLPAQLVGRDYVYTAADVEVFAATPRPPGRRPKQKE